MMNDESRLRLADCLSHMLEAARLVREHVENTVKADLLNDRLCRNSCRESAAGFTTHVLATTLLTASRAHYGSYRAIGY
jgi:hypothetical protein